MIHFVGDGGPPRNVTCNGKVLDSCVYADTERGVAYVYDDLEIAEMPATDLHFCEQEGHGLPLLKVEGVISVECQWHCPPDGIMACTRNCPEEMRPK